MKREHVIALCLLAVAIILAVQIGTTASWKEATERGSEQQVRAGTKVDSAEPGEGEQKQRRMKRIRMETKRKIVTESGLVYEILEKGEGAHPGPNSTVKVHYIGMLEDGTVFDSSRERETPAVFPLNAVIKGWTEGLQLMKPGAQYRFEIPPSLGYGDSGAGEVIPPGSTLIFEVELISIEAP